MVDQLHRARLWHPVLALLLCATAARATGFLSMESSPTAAEVWYTGPDDPDKKFLGETPLQNREMPTGKYNIWLILPSHDTLYVPEVAIAEGQITQINREIPTHYGLLEVTTDPDSADIWMDGVKIGPSPYTNNLVLPGVSKLRVFPREAYFKSSTRNLSVGKGDTIKINVSAPYRDKSFLHENLSLPAWRFQFESGLQYRSLYGSYDSSGTKVKLATDSIRTQWDFPMEARLGLPKGFELHLMLPFKNFDNRDSAPFPSNMQAGVKFTLRDYNVGFDLTYALGFKKSLEALNHDYLALTLIGMASKGQITGEAQAGFEFHFADKTKNKLTPGDIAKVHAQVGYLVDPFLPYLGLTAQFRLDGDDDGKPVKDGGYVVIPEPGLIVDVADLLSLQFGVPFTIIGKSNGLGGVQSYWGMHLSFCVGFSML